MHKKRNFDDVLTNNEKQKNEFTGIIQSNSEITYTKKIRKIQ